MNMLTNLSILTGCNGLLSFCSCSFLTSRRKLSAYSLIVNQSDHNSAIFYKFIKMYKIINFALIHFVQVFKSLLTHTERVQ